MKICSKCHRSFNDSVFYCPNCGAPLVDQPVGANNDSSPKSGLTGKAAAFNENAQKKTEEWDNSDNMLVRWLPSLLSIFGLIIAWEVSSYVGLGLAVCGIIYGSKTKNKLNKIVSLTVGIICAILCVYAACA